MSRVGILARYLGGNTSGEQREETMHIASQL
jgi:hypothetical protein